MARDEQRALGEVHVELRRLLLAIETETSKEVPDMPSLTTVRFKLTQASRRRASIVQALADDLIRSAEGARKAQLNALLVEQQSIRVKSAHHIGQWTTRSIVADWNGYCAASKTIRANMRHQIDREVAVLLS